MTLFVAVTMIVMLGFAALVIDLGQVYVARAQLQSAADAAVMAAAAELPVPGQTQNTAIEYANANDAGHGPILTPPNVVIGYWNASTSTFQAHGSPKNAVQVTTERSITNNNPVNMLLANVVGISEIETRATSIGARDVVADVVILQDVTVSFLDEIDIAVDADKALVDAFSAQHAAGVEMGVVSFARNTTDVAPLDFLTTSQGSTKAALDGMAVCADAGSAGGPCYGTDIGIGIDRARQLLVSQGRPDVEPVIVLVSDGLPCIGESSDPVGAGQVIATAAANRAGDEGINIFVITLYEPSSSTHPCYTSDVTFNESLARGFGWGTTTTNPDQLEALLTSIVTEMPIRLVK